MGTIQAPSTFGQRVRDCRLAAGLSQSELARGVARITRTKITKSLVSRWELGRVKNPHNSTLIALQAVLGVSAEWLATGRGAKTVSLVGRGGSKPLVDEARLSAALAAALDAQVPVVQPAARVAAQLYTLLTDTPDLPAEALANMAKMLNR